MIIKSSKNELKKPHKGKGSENRRFSEMNPFSILCFLAFSTAKKSWTPVNIWTTGQQKYIDCLRDKTMVVVTGPAGTGKTSIACISAIEHLQASKVDKIILTRPMVAVEEEEIGFLPGNINQKMDPWTRPVFDIFQEYYSFQKIQDMIHDRKIEMVPMAFMRGRTFHRSFIIADEMQNSSPSQMKMLTTRVGKESRMIVTGDLDQSDSFRTNGLKDFIEKYHLYMESTNSSDIEIVSLGNEDVCRSPFVNEILNIYSFYKKPILTVDVRRTDDMRIEGMKDCAIIPLRDAGRPYLK